MNKFRATGLMCSLILRGRIAVSCGLLAGFLCLPVLAQQDPQAKEPDNEGHTNRLSQESSPYLLMHAHNPLDWYPWGAEAFEKARDEDKPVFLSVGYSSCYWCHVMEREVFSNAKIAKFMNEHFVCIKVDREERPDVDDLYMTSLIVYQQAAGRAGAGGWPLSMFLDGNGNPIAGATYLPPEDTPDGRTGFLTAAERILELWKTNRDGVEQTSSLLAREVRRLSGPSVIADPIEVDEVLLRSIAAGILKRYDSEWGGVDLNPNRPDGPRFPNVPRLQFLLSMYERFEEEELLQVVTHSLDQMAMGGIRDHLGGGFHRYSTERTWRVPHFEKMLYDQAQMLEIYTRAAKLTKDPLYLQVVDEIVGYLRREMLLECGGFCSALDAETNAIEGEYYVWSREEVEQLLSAEQQAVFLTAYGFDDPENFEHGRILYTPQRITPAAAGDTDAGRQRLLAESRALLLQHREQRERPFRDDKILTEWNALLIQALSVSGTLPGREADLQLAEGAADFLLRELQRDDGQLIRSWRNEVTGPVAYLDDYACLASALRELYSATGKDRWQQAAIQLTRRQVELFHDADADVFFFTSHDHEQLLARTSSPYDSVTPSGNSLAVRNLLALRGEDASWEQLAREVLQRFSGTMQNAPASCSGLGLAALDLLADGSAQNAHREQLLPLGKRYLPASLSADESQQPGTTEKQKDRPVSVEILPYFNKLPRGARCPIAVRLKLREGWHINANPGTEFQVPTRIEVSSKQRVRLTRVRYPQGDEQPDEAGGDPLRIYAGEVLIYGILETDEQETAAEAELTVDVYYQACNDKVCLPPEKIRLRGKLPLANPGDGIRRMHTDAFPDADRKAEETPVKPG